jgi:protein TonB
MSYTNRAQDPARRTTAIAGVVVVHGLIGYALITGLRFTGMIDVPTYDPIVDFPILPDPPPPEPTDKVIPDPPRPPDLVAPQPPIELTPVGPITPLPFDPTEVPDLVIPPPGNDLIELPRPQPSFASRRAAPRNDSARWVVTGDYPPSALRRGDEGTTRFRVVVGTDGRVDACEVTGSSGNAELDAAACRNIERRARFEPASDSNGQKVVGTYTSSVSWRIPR